MTLSVGVDLGGTHLRGALVDTEGLGESAREERIRLEGADPERVAERVAELARLAIAAGGPAAAHAPVGIGVAGMLRGETGVVANAPNLGWREVDFRALVATRLPGHHIELANDVNAIAFGEFAFGAGRGATDILCVYVGTGIGGGIVAGGQLVKGAAHMAGEIGHTKVVTGPDARECGCGMRGCVEAYAGGAHLAARARAELLAGQHSSASELAGGAEHVHAGHLDEAARQGDAYANRLWDEIAPLLGLVLANAVTLLNPGRVILGGGVLFGAPELRRRVVAAYREQVNRPSGEAAQLVEPALGEMAGILGAATLAAAAAQVGLARR